jgi:hypothetical protein
MTAFRLILFIGTSVVFVALGLVHKDLLHCSRLDPQHPIALSNYFDARGFPFAWLATDEGTCGYLPGVPAHILWHEMLQSLACWMLVATVAGFLLRRRTRDPAAPSNS